MECERESNSPLEHGWHPGRLHQQTMTQDIQPFRETLTSKRGDWRIGHARKDQEAQEMGQSASFTPRTLTLGAMSTGVKQSNSAWNSQCDRHVRKRLSL